MLHLSRVFASCTCAVTFESVTCHFFIAQTRNNGRGHAFGNNVELAVLKRGIGNEAHERLSVKRQARVVSARNKVRFRFARQRGIVSKQAMVVVFVDQNGVQGGGNLLAGAHHLVPLHLLFALFSYLNRGNGCADHSVGGTFNGVFHFIFYARKKPHECSFKSNAAYLGHFYISSYCAIL